MNNKKDKNHQYCFFTDSKSTILLIILSLFVATPIFASYAYRTKDKYMIRAFNALQKLFDYYKNNTGNYPMDDSNSTAMFKLAIFLNQNGPPKRDNNQDWGLESDGLRLICNKGIYDADNIELLRIESIGTGNTNVQLYDSWGNTIQILVPGKENQVDFYSFGKNGKFDNYGKDDILSWGDPYNERYNKYYPIPLKVRINWFIHDVICSPIPLVVVPIIFILILFSIFKKK
ncbi:MAG: hypothetical protein JXA96_17650 [Sedimentisphaerales bacterium]|nr:hypothetical protein [Sedimentisphaerales bacterium]